MWCDIRGPWPVVVGGGGMARAGGLGVGGVVGLLRYAFSTIKKGTST